ncbi:cation:proton antiporter [Aurantimonas sp. VKM B-3413]|uniref:cation:proton antiporter n=1 Tax=Aurantimonas sp. VKM B-3413 TaxID=2779401 RepID=UPI001E3A7071|nr:cation:proton antiporter [Aurantimonas sp. VKM B-3413]MCB8837564.1 cation:proton antiporter [Aurantimonas sp. VKM B-3413]
MTVSTIVVLVASLVTFGALARPVADWLRLPVSIILALGGATLGFACLYSIAHPGTLLPTEFATVIADLPIGSSLFLYVFLPTLIFQASLEVDVHRVREDLIPIVLLALVAVVVATFGVAAALWPFSGMPLVACLLLASLIATTDPVAVIAIFKDVGAPERLTRLVEGESLFNDAAAISLFLLFSASLIAPASVTTSRIVSDLLLLPIGGAVVGFLAAQLTIQLLALIGEDRVTAVSLSLALPYLAFWVCEQVFDVSGVIAVASAGVTLASLAPGRVTNGTWRYLCTSWEQLASWSSILIFVLASLLVPRLISDIDPYDFVLLAIVFLAAIGTRALILFVLLPVLTRVGLRSPPVPLRYRVVVLWGGLRGSVTLALALAVTENAAVPRDIAAFVATLATGFTLVTLFVQGTTLRLLIQSLGLNRLSGVDRAVRDIALNFAAGRVAKVTGEMAGRFENRRGPGEPAAPVAASESGMAERPGGGADAAGLPEAEKVSIALVSLSAQERECVLDHFARGTVAPAIARRLASETKRRLDLARQAGLDGYRASVAQETELAPGDHLAYSAQRRLGISRPLAARLATRFETLIETDLVLTELVRFVGAELKPVLGAATADLVVSALAERAARIERELAAVRLQFPAYVAELERGFVERSARAREAQEISRLRMSGLISLEVERDLLAGLAERERRSRRRPALDLELDTMVLIERSDLFAHLSVAHRANLARMTRPVFAAPGMRIIARGDVGTEAYFIASGAVEIDTGSGIHRLGRGDVVGEMALLFDMRRQADVVAIAYCSLLRLSVSDFRRFLALDPKMRATIETIARQRLGANAASAAGSPTRSSEDPLSADSMNPTQSAPAIS